MSKNIAILVLGLFFLSACSDNSTVTIFEKNLPKNRINCINLVVFPPNEEVQKTFEALYSFDKKCPYTLEVSTKSGITCNSNHNYQTKAVGEFPSSYLKMQMNHGSKILYSYYIDLKNAVSRDDVKSAFSRLEEDLSL